MIENDNRELEQKTDVGKIVDDLLNDLSSLDSTKINYYIEADSQVVDAGNDRPGVDRDLASREFECPDIAEHVVNIEHRAVGVEELHVQRHDPDRRGRLVPARRPMRR